MLSNRSPWITQLPTGRQSHTLTADISSDVAIVGGGIAGISTAYYLLKNTNFKVTIVEANRIAHGATGHNAGLLYSGFETSLPTLIEQFGHDLTNQAQQAINSSWDLLADIYRDTDIPTPYFTFVGYTGCQSLAEIIDYLTNLKLQPSPNPNENIIIASEISSLIPEEFHGFYTLVPQTDLLNLLETNDPIYIGVHTSQMGCMNSAVFCEELIIYMLKHYPDRLQVFEHTPVTQIHMQADQVTIQTANHQVVSQHIVLCTNGYENFTIINHGGSDIQSKLRKLVRGLIGYVVAYDEDSQRPPASMSYQPIQHKSTKDPYLAEPYFYMSRRPFALPHAPITNLVTIAGPEAPLPENQSYNNNLPIPESAMTDMAEFLRQTYKFAPLHIDFPYQWHGLMGYTPNGIRLIGPEPLNNRLLYNLGCNGIGILPSIYGGLKISQILSGQTLPSSIFDIPQNIT